MANILIKYFLEKFDTSPKLDIEPGPVVTISREFGCSGNDVAESLCGILNKKSTPGKHNVAWKPINKEIIEKSAKDLNLHSSKITEFFNSKQKSVIEDILSIFLESNYKSDIKIKKTIEDVVRSFADQGHVVIVGRGGVAITQHIHDALQVKLFAPLDWRILKIQTKYHISADAAKKMILEADKKRQELNDYFIKKKSDNSLYDIIINASSYSIDDMAEIIASTMKLMKII